jgi:two-component system chemotaxis response regulator CheB
VNSDEIKEELIEKLYLAANAGSKSATTFKPSITKSIQASHHKPIIRSASDKVTKLVAIGTSTGGPRALQYVLPYIPGDIDAGIVVVQHMPPGFTKSLSDRLNQLSEINVKEAEQGDIIENGCAYIAPGDRHLTVCEKSDGTLYIELLNDAPVGGHKPAANVMFSSIAKIKQKQLIGVIMTGMGADGTEGFRELVGKRKIHIIAQDEDSCVVYGMPKSVIEAGLANEVISLDKISDAIMKKLGVH